MQIMATLLQSPPNPISLAGVAEISQQLADEIGRMVLKTEGFSVEDYLSLNGNYFVEYVDGCLQVLPMPDALHQAIAFVVATLLVDYSKSDVDARTKLSPFKVWLNPRKYREPDVCFMKGENAARRTGGFWRGADLVVEVVSESNRDHDYETKRVDYARAGIPEYWIIDPSQNILRLYKLVEKSYVLHGDFGIGTTAVSPSLSGLSIDVKRLFEQAAAQA